MPPDSALPQGRLARPLLAGVLLALAVTVAAMAVYVALRD